MTSGVSLTRLPLEGDGVIKNLYHFLWTRDELDCGPKINIPDTVIYEFRQPATWYFTSRSGHIKKKSRYNLSNIRIEETFTRNSLASDIVACYLSTNAESGKTTIEYFDRQTLRDFLYKREKVDNGILQKFIEPKGTRNMVIRGAWSPKILLLERRENMRHLTDAKYSLYERAVTYEGPDHYSRAAPVRGAHLPLAIQRVCEDIVNHVAEVSFRKFSISRMAANFKVDGNDRVWLLWCSSLRLAQSFPASASADAGSLVPPASRVGAASSVSSLSSFGMPPRRQIVPSSKGPVSLLPHCEVPEVVQRAFSTNQASRAAGTHLPLDEIRPPESSSGFDGRIAKSSDRDGPHANLSENVVAIQTSTCRSCRGSVLMDRFYRVPYKTIVAHFEQFMTILAANNACARSRRRSGLQIEWPPSRELVRVVGNIGLGPLEDLREVIRTAKDRSKVVIAQEDIEIPPIIREAHPHLACADYRRYRKDPMFLYKTSAVCEDCYLVFAQVASAAKQDIFAKELQRQFDELTGTANEDPEIRAHRLHAKNVRAQAEHIERTTRQRRERKDQRRKERERKRQAQQFMASGANPGTRLAKMAGPSMPPRIDEKSLASIAVCKSEPVLEALQKRESELAEAQLSRDTGGLSATTLEEVSDLPSEFQQELRERENSFFRDLYRNPNLEHGHPLAHMISAQAKVHITEAALTSDIKSAPQPRKSKRSNGRSAALPGSGGGARRSSTQAFVSKLLSPRDLKSVDWSSPYVQPQVSGKPLMAGRKRSPRSRAADQVPTVDGNYDDRRPGSREDRPASRESQSAAEHREFLLKTLEHVQSQLDNPAPLNQAVGLAKSAELAGECIDQGTSLDAAWEARDRALVATPSNLGRVLRTAVHIGGERMMVAVDMSGEDMILTVFNPRASLSQKVEVPMSVVLENAPDSCATSEELARFVVDTLEPDTVPSLLSNAATPVKAVKKLQMKKLALRKPKGTGSKVTGDAQATRDFPWLLQTKSMEIFGSHAGDLSAREGAHRTANYWEKETKRLSSALASGSAHLTRSEAFKAHFCKAFAEAHLGRDEHALADYTAAIRAMPHNGPAYFNRSEMHARLGNYKAAIADLDAAIVRDAAHSAEYLGNRALLHRKLGHFAQAMSDYERAAVHRHMRANKRRTARLFELKSCNAAEEYKKLAAMGQSKVGRSALAALLNSDVRTRHGENIENICAALRELVLFKSIPFEILRGLAGLAQYIEISGGKYVFKQGDIGSSMFVILSGEVSVRKGVHEGGGAAADRAVGQSADSVRETFHGKGASRRSVLDDLQEFVTKPPPEEITVARLRPGVSFGEIGDGIASNPSGGDGSLELPLPAYSESEEKEGLDRRASIFVEKDAEFLVFKTSPSASKTLDAYRSWQIGHRIESFRRSSIFADWDQANLEKLAKMAMLQQFASGTILIAQGKPANDLFFVDCGVCRVSKEVDVSGTAQVQEHPIRATSYSALLDDANSQELPFQAGFSSNVSPKSGLRKSTPEKTESRRDFEVSIIGRGQVAGEFTVLENHLEIPSPVTVTALTTVDVLVIPREELSSIMHAFYGASMAKLRENLGVNTKPTKTLQSIYAENRNWEREKRKIVLSNVTMNNRLRRVQRELDASRRAQDDSVVPTFS
ncbi:Small glutamine-rich tetratricopeptide repeat-containing protein beta [Hondaea fermentalgiana]|uniref:Small glutamine-rich tetratricopeptide repeat-containing protein beta n=1 Tax=Hondaea fermentalgiana TaxID=2315210 RepID=A0A2R5GGU9_9STRA|nr:Small glutamine-rich tetratricopeptide repeat-containing protein beta [Hondaea fermentalgiana]|eukprot:GBG29825.1 Small glutamine-rich tetratricopeptide repeat-containing protein beta [Hondaea fermentalgiana]